MKIIRGKERGITLIALIVTIIILLIIAGVTIATLTESGLFEKAKLAKGKQENAEGIENTTLKEYENEIDKYLISSNREDYSNISGVIIKNQDLIDWINKLDNKEITLEDITNNGLLRRLLQSKNAVDFMITNENIMNAVVNSKYAMEELGKSTYAGYKVITNTAIRNKVLNSEFVSYFDEGSTKVPTLNDDTNAFTSSAYSTYYAYKAFDKDKQTNWWSNGEKGNEFVGYNFGKKVIPYKIEIVNYYGSTYNAYRCKTFYLQGANENSEDNYQNLTQLLTAEPNDNVQTFSIETQNSYQYLRMFVVDKYPTQDCSVGICELQIYCREIPE